MVKGVFNLDDDDQKELIIKGGIPAAILIAFAIDVIFNNGGVTTTLLELLIP